MTSDQFGGIVRTLIAASTGWLIGKGFDSALVNAVLPALGTVAVAAWSYWTNRPEKMT